MDDLQNNAGENSRMPKQLPKGIKSLDYKSKYLGESDEKGAPCPVPRCVGARKLREHVYKAHLPPIFNNNLDPRDPIIAKKRMEAVNILAGRVKRAKRSPRRLIHMLNESKVIPELSHITRDDNIAMTTVCQALKMKVPEKFTLSPINHVAVLIHWRPLVHLVASLPKILQMWFRKINLEIPQPYPALEQDGQEEQSYDEEIQPLLSQIQQQTKVPREWMDRQQHQLPDVPRQWMDQQQSPDVPRQWIDQQQSPDVPRQWIDQQHSPDVPREWMDQQQSPDVPRQWIDQQQQDVPREWMDQHQQPGVPRQWLDQQHNQPPDVPRQWMDQQQPPNIPRKWMDQPQPPDVPRKLMDQQQNQPPDAARKWMDQQQASQSSSDLPMNKRPQGDRNSKPQLRVMADGGIILYKDPSSFPVKLPPVFPGWTVAVGIDPRYSPMLSDEEFIRLRSLCAVQGVCLGEIGLDRNKPPSTWLQQDRQLKQLLSLHKPDVPIILNLTSLKDDLYGQDVYSRGLLMMMGVCDASQPIHLHAFHGTRDTVTEWLHCFPNTYFGFTELMADFNHEQIVALRSVPLNRLIIETDSTHNNPLIATVNTKDVIKEMAKYVAIKLEMPVEGVLKATVENVQQLYYLQAHQ